MEMIEMDDRVTGLHREAMQLAGAAFVLKIERNEGKYCEYLGLVRGALEKEKEAFYLVKDFDIEPTRSTLCRSAALLAFDCSDYSEAKDLISMGLSGNPPSEIAIELRDLLARVERLSA